MRGSYQTFALTSGQNRQVAGADPKRRTIYFQGSTATGWYLQPTNPMTGVDLGMATNSTQPGPRLFTRELHGPIVQQAWHVFPAGANVVLHVVETFDE